MPNLKKLGSVRAEIGTLMSYIKNSWTKPLFYLRMQINLQREEDDMFLKIGRYQILTCPASCKYGTIEVQVSD